ADTLAGLASAQGFLQSRLSGSLRLKHTPTLSFEHDDSIDHGMRINALLEGLDPDDQGGSQ
ncbi:MAG: ribosome-binding factor A, partial [Solirubrobacterales bacterium]|nr:ribosome-binding factor A [Solirubrobacterales bacterium]